jgi:hypothetical protein
MPNTLRRWSIRGWCVLLIGCAALAACSRGDPSRKPTYPVQGEVYVDGQPAGQLAVYCNNLQGMDTQNPSTTNAFTDDAGKFRLSTYLSGDGVPEGEYVLTFVWGRHNLITMTYGGPDKLKNRYIDPKKSNVRFTVEKGRPVDLGRIELTTK